LGWWEVRHYKLVCSLMNLNSTAISSLDYSCDILCLNFREYFTKGCGCCFHHEIFECELFIPKLLNIWSDCSHITLWAHVAMCDKSLLIFHVCCYFAIAFSIDIVIPWLFEWVRWIASLWLDFTRWLWGFLHRWLFLSLGRRLWCLFLSYLSFLYLILLNIFQNVWFQNISFRSCCCNFTGHDSVSSHIETSCRGNFKWSIMNHGF